MAYTVEIKKKVLKELERLPEDIRKKFKLLVLDLAEMGPVVHWPNFSKIAKDKYHCHLGYAWVACWKKEKGKLIIEVYYVGSRKDAPY